MFSIEGLIADILFIAFIGIFAYRGISRGFINGMFTFVTAILWLVLALGISFALPFVELAFLKFGWMSGFGDGLRGLAQDFMGVIQLIGLDLASILSSLEGILGVSVAEVGEVKVLADLLAVLISGIALFIPWYIFFLWVGRQFERFVRFVRAKSLFFRILGSLIGGLINIAFSGAIVFGLYFVFYSFSEYGLFAHTYEAVKSGYVTGPLVRLITPVFEMISAMLPSDLFYTISELLKGNF